MAGRKKQTMAKFARDRALKAKREAKAEKKEAKKRAKAEALELESGAEGSEETPTTGESPAAADSE